MSRRLSSMVGVGHQQTDGTNSSRPNKVAFPVPSTIPIDTQRSDSQEFQGRHRSSTPTSHPGSQTMVSFRTTNQSTFSSTVRRRISKLVLPHPSTVRIHPPATPAPRPKPWLNSIEATTLEMKTLKEMWMRDISMRLGRTWGRSGRTHRSRGRRSRCISSSIIRL